ncbi:MATE family efflux transporter [Pseudogemmobacter sonorensis]|uniref:MATE family efflux transporter n=1 Tax=Pseudogemmobacter sonorensis TaxID=2989681 RepID=UPI0036917DF5
MTRSPISYSTHARATLALGLPLVGSSLAQIALHTVDTVMVGWYGVIELAALVIGSSTFFILFVLGSGFAKAVMPLAAHARAAGQDAELRRAARMGLWLSTIFGLSIYPVFWFSEAVLLGLKQDPAVAALGQDYLRIIGLGMIPALWVAVLQSWLAALGRTQVVLAVTLVAIGINIGLNWLFVFGNAGFPEMGVAGAALTTFSVQVFSLLVLGLYAGLLPALRPYRLFRRFWRLDRPALAEVFRLGWPIGLTGLAEGGLFEASAIMMGWIGPAQLAAHGIALQVAAMTFMVHVGLSSAATIRIAGYHGIGDARALRDAAKVAIGLSLCVAAGVIALFLTLPERIVALFIDPSDPMAGQILAVGAMLLGFAALFQLADATQAMALGLLRGIKDARAPMWIAAISYWLIGIPSSYLLAFKAGYGPAGLWMGLVIGLVAAGASLMLRFWRLAPQPGVAGQPPL